MTNARNLRAFVVEAPGIEPGSENSEATCVYVRIRPTASSWFAPAGGLSPGLVTCLRFAAAPVTRALASQLVDGLPEALAGPLVDRLSDLLFRQRGQLRCRSQLCFPRGFYVVPRDPRHAARWSRSPSKPIAPYW